MCTKPNKSNMPKRQKVKVTLEDNYLSNNKSGSNQTKTGSIINKSKTTMFYSNSLVMSQDISSKPK